MQVEPTSMIVIPHLLDAIVESGPETHEIARVAYQTNTATPELNDAVDAMEEHAMALLQSMSDINKMFGTGETT